MQIEVKRSFVLSIGRIHRQRELLRCPAIAWVFPMHSSSDIPLGNIRRFTLLLAHLRASQNLASDLKLGVCRLQLKHHRRFFLFFPPVL